MVLFAAPSSTNYNLKSYDFGNGGTDNSSSANYNLDGTAGAQAGDKATSTNFSANSGLNPTQDSSVPPKPTLTNPDSYYDRLNLVLDQGSAASDTKFLISISSDGFATTRYVQTDNSIGASYTITNYQTYTSWGGATGFYITGLSQSTVYEVRVRALQGKFTESGYSPLSDAVSTSTPSLSFGVSTTLSGTPPFLVGFSSLTPNLVFAGDADGTLSLSSNANNGGTVYIRSANSGLNSASASHTISSSSTDLGSASSGYGAQVVSATQATGGPFSSIAPFNVAGNNVGALNSSLQPILVSSSPVFGATATIRFKAKADFVTPAETDYSDTVSVVAAMNY